MTSSTNNEGEELHTEDEVHEFDPDCMIIRKNHFQREAIGEFYPRMNIEVEKATLNVTRKPIYVGHIIRKGNDAYRLTSAADRGDSFVFYTERVKLEVVHE